MRFDDYVAAALPGTPAADRGGALSERIVPEPGTVPDSTLHEILAAEMFASLDVPPADGPWPLLLWSARHETVLAQSVTSEFLASHGFVVAAVQRVGERLPPPYEIADPAERPAVLEAQVGDLDETLTDLLGDPRVDPRRVALLAWSYGGESAVVLQERRDEVDMVVGLSSNLLGGWVYQASDSLPRPRHARIVPYVLLAEDETLARARSADQVTVELFPTLAHGNFNMVEGLLPSLFPDIQGHQPWVHAGPGAVEGYRAVARAVLTHVRRLRVLAAIVSDPSSRSGWPRRG